MSVWWWLHPVAAMLALLLGLLRINDLATTRFFATALGLLLIDAAAPRAPAFQPRGVSQ